MNDLLFTQGQDNLAGLVGEIYDCPTEDIESLPDLAAATSLVTEAGVDIVCKSTKKFTRLYITDETGNIKTVGVGPRDGKARESVLMGRYPASGFELEDWISDRQNTPSIQIFRLARTGDLYLMGVSRLKKTDVTLSLAIPSYFENAESDSGSARADQNGAPISWKFTAGHGPIKYVGAIPLTPAT
jgi:hypothetical protein